MYNTYEITIIIDDCKLMMGMFFTNMWASYYQCLQEDVFDQPQPQYFLRGTNQI